MSDKFEKVGKNLEDIGKGIQGCGCIIILLPILAMLLWFIWSLLFGYPAETTKEQTDKVVISQEEIGTQKIEVSTDDHAKDYINNELSSFIRSVSANVDTNWGFYFVEPVERLEQDNNLEAFVSDVSLLVDLYRGIASQVDSLETAEYLTDEDKKDIADIKDGLISAINKRIEVAETLIGMSDAMEILSTDITETLEESNEYLQSAANAYGSLLNRY